MAAMRPARMPTSAAYQGAPVPSITRPCSMMRSKAGAEPPRADGTFPRASTQHASATTRPQPASWPLMPPAALPPWCPLPAKAQRRDHSPCRRAAGTRIRRILARSPRIVIYLMTYALILIDLSSLTWDGSPGEGEGMATQARSIASLTISFGLVAIPVKLYSATQSSRSEFRSICCARKTARE